MFSRAVLISFCLITTVQAQRLVDPAKVPPELREAAEKRRAEQIRLHDCGRKAVTQKVMPRERTAFIIQCIDASEAK
jgi:hypothetical protein